jgi:hypothetical protein
MDRAGYGPAPGAGKAPDSGLTDFQPTVVCLIHRSREQHRRLALRSDRHMQLGNGDAVNHQRRSASRHHSPLGTNLQTLSFPSIATNRSAP